MGKHTSHSKHDTRIYKRVDQRIYKNINVTRIYIKTRIYKNIKLRRIANTSTRMNINQSYMSHHMRVQHITALNVRHLLIIYHGGNE